jgi:hypothetical protein
MDLKEWKCRCPYGLLPVPSSEVWDRNLSDQFRRWRVVEERLRAVKSAYDCDGHHEKSQLARQFFPVCTTSHLSADPRTTTERGRMSRPCDNKVGARRHADH